MRRIEGGIYGQPPFTGQGIPRVWYGGRYVEHVGAVALFALNAFIFHSSTRILTISSDSWSRQSGFAMRWWWMRRA